MAIKKVYIVLFLKSADDMLNNMGETDRAKTAAAIMAISKGEFHLVYTKPLRGKIRELIVKKYRFIFFTHQEFLYFVNAFIKKSKKTPKKEIDHAYKIYQEIIERIKKR
jgi:phage-related protein